MQFGGHHLAINLTMGGSQATMAPSHTAAQPATYTVFAIMTIAGGTRASAHRLDEFLQAARIAIEPDRVALEMSLTPISVR